MKWWNFWRFWSSEPLRPAPPKQAVPPNDAEAFLALAVKSGLINQVDVEEACKDFQSRSTNASEIDKLCDHLISKGVLTSWQCNKLRTGRWKGFYLDGYCFLGQIGKDQMSSTYLCKVMATGKQVAMRVTPIGFNPVRDRKIRYKVHELFNEAAFGET